MNSEIIVASKAIQSEETKGLEQGWELVDPEEQYALIPASQLYDNPNNPRRVYDASALGELAKDFKIQGQSTPCVVRDIGGGQYQIAAGHRRVRAGRMAFGDMAKIKCLIRVLTDAQMHHLAVTENKLREETTVIDDAEACERMLALCDGDRESAASHMHMNTALFDRRLALLALGESSRQALAEKKIVLGVAELLASVPVKMQDKVLPQIIEQKLSVDFVRSEVLRAARPLSEAIFDKGECGDCAFNSDRQQGLFEHVIDGGNCTNAPCFRKKSSEAVQAAEEELKARFPRVLVINKADGDKGIVLDAVSLGEAQVSACKGCGDFGASISNVPGSYGKVVEGVCLNSTCNAEKAKAFKAAQKAEAKKAAGVASAGQANPQTAKPTSATSGQLDTTAIPSTAATTRAVKEYRTALWRKAIEGVAARKPVEARVALLALAADHQASCLDNEIVREQCSKAMSLEARLASYGHDEIEADMTVAIAKMAAKASEASLPVLLEHFDCDLSEFFCADEAFLKILTRSEMEAYAESVGLKEALGDEWRKANTGKKDEVISAYLAAKAFDFSRVPSFLKPGSSI